MNKHYRLRRRDEFRYVYRRGKGTGSALMVLHTAPRRDGKLHIGFSVSKKIGNSVVRNRVKRRLREAARSFIPCLKQGQSMIFVARNPLVEAEYQEILGVMANLLRKSALLKSGTQKPPS